MINVKKSVISCLFAFASLNVVAADSYDVIDLGYLDDLEAFAQSINNDGVVVGYSYTTQVTSQNQFVNFPKHGFAQLNGVMTDLGAIDNPAPDADTDATDISAAFSINDIGVVSGYSLESVVTGTDSEDNPTYSNFERATFTDLDSLTINLVPPLVADDNQNMRALASNSSGIVIGVAQFNPTDDVNSEGDPVNIVLSRGFVYDSNSEVLTKIDPINYAQNVLEATLRDININGRIVGVSTKIVNENNGFSYKGFYIDVNDLDNLIELPLSEQERANQPHAINDNDVIVGRRHVGDSFYYTGFIYDINAETTIDFPELRAGYKAESFNTSIAYDINNNNQVVGTALINVVPDRYHAVIYENDTLKDLNKLIDCKVDASEQPIGAPDWELYEARAINDSGVIVGNGFFKNERKAFMLVPRTGVAPSLCQETQTDKSGSGSLPVGFVGFLLLAGLIGRKKYLI